jgi:hypothetical protein
MLRGGACLAAALVLTGCLHETYDPSLPPVRPEGPAANVLTQHGRGASAQAHLGWMIAYQASGHFAGYSDAEKVAASRLRSAGLICRNDRDTRMKITYPSGPWGMPVHLHADACPVSYAGLPKPEAFGGASQEQVVAAARMLGMTCEGVADHNVCQIEVQWTVDRAKAIETVRRRAVATIDAAGQVQLTTAGFEAGS